MDPSCDVSNDGKENSGLQAQGISDGLETKFDQFNLKSLDLIFDRQGYCKNSPNESETRALTEQIYIEIQGISADELASVLSGFKKLNPYYTTLSLEQVIKLVEKYTTVKNYIEKGNWENIIPVCDSPHRPSKLVHEERVEGRLAKLSGDEYIRELCEPLETLLTKNEFDSLVNAVKNYLKNERTEFKDNCLETISNAFRFGTIYPFRKVGIMISLAIDGCSFDYNEIYRNVSYIYSIIGDVREALNYRHRCTDLNGIIGFHDIVFNNADNIINGGDYNLAMLLSATQTYVRSDFSNALEEFYQLSEDTENVESEKILCMHTAYMAHLCCSIIDSRIRKKDDDYSSMMRYMSDFFLKEASNFGSRLASFELNDLEKNESEKKGN